MRLTIIVPDKTIIIDGEAYSGISTDWSWVQKNIHAIQWYDTWGEVEYSDEKNNEKIDNLGSYSVAVTHHQNEKQRIIDIENQTKYENEQDRDWSRILRKFRNKRLFESDWTQIGDNSLTEEQKEDWKIYRQKLRDLPANIEEDKYQELVIDFENPLWPLKPD